MPFSRKYIKEIIALALIIANIYIWQAIWWRQNNKFLSVYFLDIGQGDAILIESPSGNKMLIDAGAGKSILRELSEVLSFYDKNIEVILVTHPDQDHLGGLVPVLERFNVQYIIESGNKASTKIFGRFENLVENSGAERIVAHRGMTINLGSRVVLLVLFPDRNVYGLDSNSASIITKLYFGETSFMLTGDAPQKIEEYLVSLDGEILQSDVLKVGHHGSKTSSAPSFIESVKPKYAVIQAGRDNKYGHPHKEVLDILKSRSLNILANSELGTIHFVSDGQKLMIK